MSDFRLKSIDFRDSNSTRVPLGKLTVLVGPNNSGKSKTLKEIRSMVLGVLSVDEGISCHSDIPDAIVVSNLEVDMSSEKEEFLRSYDIRKKMHSASGMYRLGDYCNSGLIVRPDGFFEWRNIAESTDSDWERAYIDSYFESDEWNRNESWSSMMRLIGPAFISYSGTEERLILSNGEPYKGVSDQETNLLSSIFLSDPTLERLSHETIKHFNRDVFFDNISEGGVLKIRVAKNGSFAQFRRTGFYKGIVDKISQYGLLQDEGDGFRSFVSIGLTLLAEGKPVKLIDEPETFLHPPQARAMGRMIAESAAEGGAQIIVATHSAEILDGIIAGFRGDEGLSIVRLCRANEDLQVKRLDPNDLSDILKDKLMRSSRLYGGIFAHHVVVVESEDDEVIYKQLLDYLLPENDMHFVNVHSKDRIEAAVHFYQMLGVDCYAISDFDIINNNGKFKNLFKRFCEDDWEAQNRFRTVGESIRKTIKENGGDYKKGVQESLGECLNDANKMIDDLIDRGLLIVRTGELETIFDSDLEHSHTDGWFGRALDYLDNLDQEGFESLSIVGDLRRLLGVCGKK